MLFIPLTQDEKEIYVDNPGRCPVCQNDDLAKGDFTPFTEDGSDHLRDIVCTDCGRAWMEHVVLHEVVDADDDGWDYEPEETEEEENEQGGIRRRVGGLG